MSDTQHEGAVLEAQRLELDRYKAQLDFRKFIWGSVVAGITIAAIPPLFQLATAYLEYVKSEAARLSQAQQFRDSYVKEFLSTALNQDIEVRIRFAQYFSRVSSDKESWVRYLDDLRQLRELKRTEIDGLELEWQSIADVPRASASEVGKLKRKLDWAYSEVGYAVPNRSAISNPRAPEEARVATGLSLSSITTGQRREIAQKIADAFAAAGFGQLQQGAAIANALAMSNLDPTASYLRGEDSWGLFLLNRNGGLGAGHTKEELQNPDVNIRIILEAAKKVPEFRTAGTVDEAVDVFVRKIERPENPNVEVLRQQQIARRLFRS